tara:strand:+ start:798 stop:1058 length:261 start_codon:yes stop_codon:yes gene_type:complete
MVLFSLLYIQTDSPYQSDILGLFDTKEKAVDELLERANYREKNGKLTQYFIETNEYNSFQELKNEVMKKNELNDVDIYRIVPLHLN